MARWAFKLVVALGLSASAAQAGVVNVYIPGVITGFEQNPVTGSTQTSYNPDLGPNFAAILSVIAYPTVNGFVDIPTPKEASYLTGVVLVEYYRNVSGLNGYGFAGISNNDYAISADATFNNGKLVDLQFLTFDQLRKYTKRSDGLIRVDGEEMRFGYDATYAPLFTDATTIARLDFGNAVYSYVPEAETWALMILGFGFVGTAVRQRRGLSLNVG